MRRRGASAVTLLIALCLLPAGIGAAMGQRTQARAGLEAGLAHTATEQAEVLSDYFQRARSLTLLAAHNPSFADFYAAPGTRAEKVQANGPLMTRIHEGLAYLETLFPGSIGEACFIDRSGAEVARTVHGVRAIVSSLSTNESANPFFAPTFAMAVGSVYQARPYVSPDTGDWVISNSTPLATPDGAKPAILHFEVTLESFRAAAGRAGQYPVEVVDAATGAVVFDSRFPLRAGARLGAGRTALPALPVSAPSGGRLTVDGRPAAYQRIAAQPGNTNDWIVVAVAPDRPGFLFGIGSVSIGLVVAAVLLVVLSGLLDLLARRELVAAAMTDPLTGLGNRRALARDLRLQIRAASESRPLVLVLLDLNGFKSYNDAFGHSAGDELLIRLGTALAAAVGRGRAYRLGGDEFCVLAPVGEGGVDRVVDAASAALSERGSGFVVDASHGSIVLPVETHDADEALRLVDLRMYAQKRDGRGSAGRQTRDALLHALGERNPELRARLGAVAALVAEVAEALGLPAEEARYAVQAAELCEIGHVAIPDAILAKGDRLDPREQAFVRNLPVVSERILMAAPALTPVAALVRSTFEHVDGSGIPDGLGGSDIPLGSRIVAACHRYVTLLHRHGGEHADAGAVAGTLRREGGTRLDPDVVEAVLAVAAARTARVLEGAS